MLPNPQYYSFGHEMAHNLGCLHDRGTQNACSSANSNYGYRDPQGRFRSINAYSCKTDQCDNISKASCPRRKFFSNTGTWTEGNVEYPAGNEQANNAKQISDVLSTVSGYYATVVPEGGGPECTADSDCDDGDDCNGLETCDGDGVCQAGPPAESCCGNGQCDADETALTCPSDCVFDCGDSCSNLESTFAGGNGAGGNYFTVEAHKDLFVTSFTIHATTTGTGAVRVYHAAGDYGNVMTSRDKWTLIYEDESLAGKGNGNETPLGKLSAPVFAEAGTRHSFYVYASNGVRYTTSGASEGDVFSENEGEMTFYQGRGSGGEFSASTWAPRVWNGRIEYGLADGSSPSTGSPTKLPTGQPTRPPTRPPTGDPTGQVSLFVPAGVSMRRIILLLQMLKHLFVFCTAHDGIPHTRAIGKAHESPHGQSHDTGAYSVGNREISYTVLCSN